VFRGDCGNLSPLVAGRAGGVGKGDNSTILNKNVGFRETEMGMKRYSGSLLGGENFL